MRHLNEQFNRLLTLIICLLVTALLAPQLWGAEPLISIDQSRGVDQRVDYKDLLKYPPWDDRNYSLTQEDLALLSENESELHPGIPLFFRVELRKEFPQMRKTGPMQYPSAARPLFKLRHGGLLQNGITIGSRQNTVDESSGAAQVNGEVQLNQIQGANEITIEINPVNPNQVIAGANNNGQEMYYSTNGGQSWTIQGKLGHSCCDPTVAWSSDGTMGYVGTLTPWLGISFLRSFDGGQTWQDRVDLTEDGSDKEFLHVDLSPTSPYKDNIYLTWHDFNVMQFARSSNLGVSFDITSFPSANPGLGSDITTDSAGNIYYIFPSWDNGLGLTEPGIRLLKSLDGGVSFSAPKIIAPMHQAPQFPIPAMDARRVTVVATADADRSGGDYDGSVYVAYTNFIYVDEHGGGGVPEDYHAQVHVYFSRDGGATWNSSFPHPTADIMSVDRFNQWLNVDEFGNVHVVFYDTRNSVNRSGVDLYYTFSVDGAQTWSELTRVSSETSSQLNDGQEFGDYNGLSVINGTVLPAWTDNRAGPPDERDVYSAKRVSPVGDQFSLTGDNLQQQVCRPAELATIHLEASSGQDFTDPVALSLQGLPAGVSGSFTVNPVTPGILPGLSNLAVSVDGSVAAGDYTFEVTAFPPATSGSLEIDLSVSTLTPGSFTLLTPSNAAVAQPSTPELSWSAAVQADYLVEIDDDPAFTSIDYQASVSETSHVVQPGLPIGRVYYWRVRANNGCGSSTSEVFSFETVSDYCATPNLVIPDNDPAGVYHQLGVAESGGLVDLNISLVASHGWPGDMKFTLEHLDTSTIVNLIDRPGVPEPNINGDYGCEEADINLLLDDNAAASVESTCPLSGGLVLRPESPLAAFNGENLRGTWQIHMVDSEDGSQGILTSWCIIPVYGDDVFADGFEDLLEE